MNNDVLAVNVPEAARRLSVSPRTIAALVAQRKLPSRKIGRRRVIPIRALQEFLTRNHKIECPKRNDLQERVSVGSPR